MTAAWTGIINSDPPMTYVSVRPSRYSHKLISKTKDFVINLPTLALAEITDWVGVKSGKNINKIKELNLKVEASHKVSSPQILQSPVSLECKVVDVQHFKTHDMFLAQIVGVSVDDKYIDKAGCLRLEKAGLLAYMHGFYYTLGRQIGKFGYSVEKGRPTPVFKEKSQKKKGPKNQTLGCGLF